MSIAILHIELCFSSGKDFFVLQHNNPEFPIDHNKMSRLLRHTHLCHGLRHYRKVQHRHFHLPDTSFQVHGEYSSPNFGCIYFVELSDVNVVVILSVVWSDE